MSSSQEEILFDRVAQYLYRGTIYQARKEFSLYLFAEWSKSNMDIILEIITQSKFKKR